MLTLATHQSATWGYSYVNYPSTETDITAATGTISNTGMFTKLVLAHNGKMYGILGNSSITINGTVYTNAIVEVTPGSTNTGTTNWSKCTFNYLTPDPGVSIGASGFGKPSWTGPSTASGGNSANAYNTGILAPNGLIYFAPLDFSAGLTGGTYKWIVLNPTSGQWKKLNLHPDYPESTYPNGIPVGYYSIFTSPILGNDGKIYIFAAGLNKLYRFTPTSNALGDEASFETAPTFTTADHPLTGTNLSWVNETGTSFTDTASAASISYAYQKETMVGSSTLFNISDAIAHPNGNIYWIPGSGRGRIFYTKPSLFGTRPYVSATGLIIGGTSPQKGIYSQYAFLEKPRDADHDPTTLKIYIVSRTTATVGYEDRVICLNPVTHTLSYIDLGISHSSVSGLGKNITLANGMHMSFHYNGTNVSSGRNILTGWDVPSSVSNGARIITRANKGVLENQMGGAFSSSSTGITTPGYSKIGGGANAPYPHHSKFIINASTADYNNLFSELVSVKQYGPGITNFNFANRDIPFYSVPLTELAGSIFNANFNKPR